MPAKTKIARFLREWQASDAAPVQRTRSRPSGLYLLELRSQAAQSPLPRRKLVISVDPNFSEDAAARPVKITHT